MKLIVSELEALRSYVSREFYHVMTDLITHFNWRHVETQKLWNAPGNIKEKLLAECHELPETILFWEGYEMLFRHATELYQLPGRKAILADDLHWWDGAMRTRKAVSYASCDVVLSTYGYVWDKFYPEFAGSKKVVWVPHSASPDFVVPYNRNPENAIFVSGAAGRYYPMREQMKSLHAQGSYSLVCQSHPGYFTGYDYENDERVGSGYAREINKYRAAFTDSLIYNYVVAKYFEIPATGALLLADDAVSGPLAQLGFIENQHYVPVSAENLEEKIAFVLDERNHDQLDEIRSRAHQLVWARHKSIDRARQIDEACVST